MVKVSASKHSREALVKDVKFEKGHRIFCEFHDGKTWCTVIAGPVYHDEADAYGYDVTCDDRPGEVIFVKYGNIADWQRP